MENAAQKTDRRVLRTKKAIHRAMAQLIAEKDINDISVTDIAALADINRKTFYNYYTGVYQLLDEIENDIVDYFADLIKTTDFEQALADPALVFEKLYEAISRNAAFVDSLFSTRGHDSLTGKILGKLIELTRDAAVEQLHSDPEKTEYIVRFIFAGEIAVYQAWYHSDRNVPIRELSRTVEILCTRGLDGLLAESAAK